ncbi:hypothetical protein [Bradyrhizobium tropiciagri]|nr:hypothetical protein [Bradyrhizobium tropiciagri]
MITRFDDPMLEKVTAWAPHRDKVVDRMVQELTDHPRVTTSLRSCTS